MWIIIFWLWAVIIREDFKVAIWELTWHLANYREQSSVTENTVKQIEGHYLTTGILMITILSLFEKWYFQIHISGDPVFYELLHWFKHFIFRSQWLNVLQLNKFKQLPLSLSAICNCNADIDIPGTLHCLDIQLQ